MEREGARRMLSWGSAAHGGRRYNAKVFLIYVFNDACFPSMCEDRIKIKTPSSDFKLPAAQMVF